MAKVFQEVFCSHEFPLLFSCFDTEQKSGNSMRIKRLVERSILHVLGSDRERKRKKSPHEMTFA